MLDERQPHLLRLFHHICHIAGLQFAHQVVAVKFYGIVADVQLPGDGIGRMSLGYVLQDFEWVITPYIIYIMWEKSEMLC